MDSQTAVNLKIGQRIDHERLKGKVIGTASYLQSDGKMTFGYVIALDTGFYNPLQRSMYVSVTVVNVDSELLK